MREVIDTRSLESIEEHKLAVRCGYSDAQWTALARDRGLKELLLDEAVRRKALAEPVKSEAGKRPPRASGDELLAVAFEGSAKVRRMMALATARPERRLA